jgi:hypothetical protein
MAASARDLVNERLGQYGLDERYRSNDGRPIGDWAWERYLETGDIDMVLTELRSQQGFKDRFPAYDYLASQGRAITPDQYVAYETQFYGLAQAYGVPDGVFGADYITSMLKNDVSASEASERFAINAEASLTAPSEVRTALADMYGVTEGGMLAYYLDADQALPVLKQQFTAAQIQGASMERQFSLQRAQAEDLAARGVTYEQTREAAKNADLSRGLVGEQGVAEADLLLAGLGNSEAIRDVTRAALSRRSRFSGGGSAAQEQGGVAGLGSASTS